MALPTTFLDTLAAGGTVGIGILLILLPVSVLVAYFVFQYTLQVRINLIPLTNLVLLLTILLLMATQLTRWKARTRSAAATAAHNSRWSGASSPGNLPIRVLRNGEILFAGQTVPAAEVTARLERSLADARGELRVYLQTDGTVQYRFVEPLLTACGRLGVREITLDVVPSEGG